MGRRLMKRETPRMLMLVAIIVATLIVGWLAYRSGHFIGRN